MLSLDLRVQTALSFFSSNPTVSICLVFWAGPRIHNLYRIPLSGGEKRMHKSALLFCETLLQAMEWSKAASVQQKSALSATLEARRLLQRERNTCCYFSYIIENINALHIHSFPQCAKVITLHCHHCHCRHFRSDIAASHVHCDLGFAPLGCL